MWEGDGSGWGQSWAGASGKIHKWEWLGGMTFIWWGVGMLVKIAKDNSRDQESREIKRKSNDNRHSWVWGD